MGKAQDTYSLDDLQSDAAHLGHLIATIADHVIHECAYVAPADVGKSDAPRLPGMDRLGALIWIARDQIDVLNENIEKHYSEIKGRKMGGADA